MKDLCDIIREWRQRRGESLALATLVRARGSSYRRPGARMLISPDGKTVGSLSGGCLEEEVALRAREVIRTGVPAVMEFDTRRRFGCAGSIEIFIERVDEEFLGDLSRNLEARRSCFAVTTFEGDPRELGSHVLEFSVAKPGLEGGAPATPLGPRSRRSSTLQLPENGKYNNGGNGRLVQEIHPPIQLLICGDGPDIMPLRSLGELLGWQRIDIEQASQLPTEVDEWTAAIVMFHNYGRDFAALRQLLPLELRYVGIVGPRKRRDQLLADYLDAGGSINANVFAPAGLDLGADSPEEIALAIVAEIQSIFTDASHESLRARRARIHVVDPGLDASAVSA